MSSLDIVTVCFSGDLPLLKLQIRSLHRFFPDPEIRCYHIILNEDSPADLKKHLENDLLPEFPALASKTRIRARNELSSPPGPECRGWTIQQALKLLIAREVDSEFYLVLDAKNHFLQPVSLSDFLTNEKRTLLHYQLKHPPALDWLHDSLAYFGNALAVAEKPVPPTITPYPMKADLVREMIREIEDKEKCNLMEYFCRKTGGTTEFFLYSSFVWSRFGSWESVFENRKAPFSSTLFQNWPQDPAAIERLLKNLESGKIKCFGLHRMRVEQLSSDMAARLSRIWMEAGLFPDTHSAAEFLKSLGWRNG